MYEDFSELTKKAPQPLQRGISPFVGGRLDLPTLNIPVNAENIEF